MTKEDTKPLPKVPDWAINVFSQFLDNSERRDNILRLSINELSRARASFKLIKAISNLEKERSKKSGSKPRRVDIRQAEKDVRFAEEEMKKGFPILYEQATISLWGSLEALIRNFVALWLHHVPSAKRCDAVKQLKVKIGEYESLEDFERCLWIVDLIDQEIAGPLKVGVGRFECLLEPFEMNGAIDDDCRRSLLELSKVRNILVHKNGIADRKFTESCAWLGYRPGDHVVVDKERWTSYTNAVHNYVLQLIYRLQRRFGQEPHLLKKD